MPTVTQAFDDFMRGLELTDKEQDKASRQHNELRERIRGQLGGVARDIIVGSYARRTAIRPLNDIDLFVILDPEVHTDRHRKGAEDMLETLRQKLVGCYSSPGPQVRIQGRSVNIEFSGTGIGYDVIPAFLLTPNATKVRDMIYEIPDRDRKAWIKTNPEIHRERCVEANERAGSMLNRLIKAAKHWNRSQRGDDGRKLLRSFHLEVMAYEAFGAKPADERRGLRELFSALQARVTLKCPEPAGLGPHVDIGMTSEERRKIQLRLLDAERIATEAVRYEDRGDQAAACKSWRSLLGSEFQI